MNNLHRRAAVTRVLFALLTVAWAVFIFLQSSKHAAASDTDSLFIADRLLTLLGISPADADALSAMNHIIRKCAHFSEYALLGLLCGGLLQSFCGRRDEGARLTRPAGALYTLGICTVYACTDELHQAFVPGRAPAVTDVLIDAAGAATGAAICWLIFFFLRRRAHRRNNAKDEEETQ